MPGKTGTNSFWSIATRKGKHRELRLNIEKQNGAISSHINRANFRDFVSGSC
ncbi:hypothetical protein [Nitrosospira sp. Nl5]|uniref:hypothetical protein n=1 Tax=Nitrosospira sp. Nl5 TaxID=200120 RepID=UPI0015A3EC91|nr:hypothetical protein [Nitrosospira sp. Nl5]